MERVIEIEIEEINMKKIQEETKSSWEESANNDETKCMSPGCLQPKQEEQELEQEEELEVLEIT